MPNLGSTGYGTVVSPLSLVLVPLHNWKYWCPCLVYIRHLGSQTKYIKVHSHIKIVSFNLVWIVRSIPQLTATFHILSSVLLWMWLRLAINEVRRVGPGGLLWLGLCCNSFSKMFLGERGAKFLFFKNCLNLWKSIYGVGSWYYWQNVFLPQTQTRNKLIRSRGTHGRDSLFPLGNTGYGFVKLGNLLAARCCLLILLAICRGLIFVLEQPDGSAFPFHPRWQEVITHNKVTHSNDMFCCFFMLFQQQFNSEIVGGGNSCKWLNVLSHTKCSYNCSISCTFACYRGMEH